MWILATQELRLPLITSFCTQHTATNVIARKPIRDLSTAKQYIPFNFTITLDEITESSFPQVIILYLFLSFFFIMASVEIYPSPSSLLDYVTETRD